MKLRRLVVPLALLSLVACDPSGGTVEVPADAGPPDAGPPDAGPPPRDAGPGPVETRLILVNLIDDDPALDALHTVGAQEHEGPPIGATSIDRVLEGTRTVTLRMRGEASLEVTTVAGTSTFVIASGDADTIDLETFTLPDELGSGSRFQLLHTLPALGTLDASVRDTDTDDVVTLATDLLPGEVTDAVVLAADAFFHVEVDTDDDGAMDLRFQTASGGLLERAVIGQLDGVPYLLHVQGERGFYPVFRAGPPRDAADVAFVNLLPDVTSVDVWVGGAERATGVAFGQSVELTGVSYDPGSIQIIESGGATLLTDSPLRYFDDTAFMVAYGPDGARGLRDFGWERQPVLPVRQTGISWFVHLASSLGRIAVSQTTTVPTRELEPGQPVASTAQEGDVISIDVDRDGTDDHAWTIPALTPTRSYVAFLGDDGGTPRLVLVDADAAAQVLAENP